MAQHTDYTYWGDELNRVTITTPNGPLRLSVPLYDSRKQQPIEDMRICYMHAWQRQHWAALFSAYGKQPYWEYYADYIHALYEKQPTYLMDLNQETAYILRSLISNTPPGKEVQLVEAIHQPGILDELFALGPEVKLINL